MGSPFARVVCACVGPRLHAGHRASSVSRGAAPARQLFGLVGLTPRMRVHHVHLRLPTSHAFGALFLTLTCVLSSNMNSINITELRVISVLSWGAADRWMTVTFFVFFPDPHVGPTVSLQRRTYAYGLFTDCLDCAHSETPFGCPLKHETFH